MKLWLDFEPCKKCAKYIADLTDEEFFFTDDITRNEMSAKFLRHLMYNHPDVIHSISKEVKTQQIRPEFDLYK